MQNSIIVHTVPNYDTDHIDILQTKLDLKRKIPVQHTNYKNTKITMTKYKRQNAKASGERTDMIRMARPLSSAGKDKIMAPRVLIYSGVSEKYWRGIWDATQCLKTSTHKVKHFAKYIYIHFPWSNNFYKIIFSNTFIFDNKYTYKSFNLVIGYAYYCPGDFRDTAM